MKLLRIHVDNFGKINDLEINFADGINVIKEPNAWGKSTLAAFIKVMLYGFDAKKAAGAPEKERSFYMPWQGGVYGGELDFSVGNRSYRISRTFGATEKKDECHIYDLETMLESVDFTGNIGEQLFDLDSNSFKRSVFIAHNDCASQTSDAINAKLGNLVENTNDINNYESAMTQLKDMANSLTPNRVTGSIKRRRNQITEVETELKPYQSVLDSLAELESMRAEAQARKDELVAGREALANELRLASEDSRRKELQKQYMLLCKEEVDKLEAATEFESTFPNGVPSEEEYDSMLAFARKLEEKKLQMSHLDFSESEKDTYEKLNTMFSSGIPTEAEIDSMINRYGQVADIKEDKYRLNASLEEKEKTSMVVEPLPDKPKSMNAFTFAGIAVAVIGIIAFILSIVAYVVWAQPPYYMFGGVAIILVSTILFVIANLVYRRANRIYEDEVTRFMQRQQEELDEIDEIKNEAIGKENQITGIEEEVRQFLEKYSVYCGIASYSGALYELKNQAKDYIRLNDRKNECSRIEFACRADEAKLKEFTERWKFDIADDYSNGLIRLQPLTTKYRAALEEKERATANRVQFESQNDMEDLKTRAQAADSLDAINNQIADYDARLESVRMTIDQYARQMEEKRETLDRLDEKREELSDLLASQEADEKHYSIISKTQEYLSTAKERFTARYMAPISDAFRKYYNIIHPVENDDWVIDAHIAVKRREMGELRSVNNLSSGYQDLIGVCMRFALVDAMYQEEKPFLVLDDPFVNLDEDKTEKGMELLNYVANDYQTIYFTCHNSRTPV